MPPQESPSFWLKRARWLTFVVNVAWFWQRFTPLFVGINLIFTAAILIVRRGGESALSLFPWYLAVTGLALGWTLWRARGTAYTLPDALLRIETALGLQNRLSCAYAGTLEWPSPQAYRGRVIGLRPHVAVLPLVYSAAFVLAGLWLPIQSTQAKPVSGDSIEPSAWTQVADWADLLKEERIVAAEEVEKLEEQLSELREQPKEEWYSQGSLEAGEALRDETRLAMQELARQLQSTSTFLEEMSRQQAAPTLNSASVEQLDEAWQQQLQKLQMSQPALDPKMLKQLQSMSFSQMNSLSPQQMKELQKRLQQSAGQCSGASGLSELDLQAVKIKTQQMAAGDIQRGPGPAPLVMLDEGTDLATGAYEGVSNKDLRNAVMGETVGISSRPGNDEQADTFEAGVSVENAAELGAGGDVVWRESYTPRERAILEDYFQ